LAKESHAAHITSDRKTLSQKVEVSNYGHAALDQLQKLTPFCVCATVCVINAEQIPRGTRARGDKGVQQLEALCA